MAHHGISGWAIFIILLILIIIIGIASWIIFTHLRARRLGLPPPSLNPFSSSTSSSSRGYPTASGYGSGGVTNWIKTKISSLKNTRTAGGAYEEPLSSGGGGAGGRGRRGFGALDPDEAWDTRVGTEADAYGPGGYYEEQELGLHAPAPSAYGGGGYGGGAGGGELPEYGEERGRSRSRDAGSIGYVGGSKGGLDRRYEEEMGGAGQKDPFADEEAERSELRGVSPRPVVDTGLGHKAQQGSKGSLEDSPTERRSMFREQM
ncbi:MAG: hypothetical protein M1827_006000 [Pycnora praestabilis]|nr:MAG: hypothetical protein M1827_006000 [Pycnora praestabilis]